MRNLIKEAIRDYVNESYNLQNAVNNVKVITKLRLIFPLSNWEEKALNLLKSLGVITASFKTAQDATNAIDELVRTSKIQLQELVIGSHGNGKDILITQRGVQGVEQFYQKLKTIINQSTKIFFTACNGTDNMVGLVRTANILGVGIYAAEGSYLPAFNSAEGFYYIKPYANIEKLQEKFIYQNDKMFAELLRLGVVKKVDSSPISWFST